MGCEESFITMKLIWHNYLVPNLGNYAHETPLRLALSALCWTSIGSQNLEAPW